MRLRWMVGLVSALVLTGLFAIPAPAFAYHSGTVSSATVVSDNSLVLDINHYRGYTFTVGVGDSISYGIQVVTPALTNIDVYFFAASGLPGDRSDPPATSPALTPLRD